MQLYRVTRETIRHPWTVEARDATPRDYAEATIDAHASKLPKDAIATLAGLAGSALATRRAPPARGWARSPLVAEALGRGRPLLHGRGALLMAQHYGQPCDVVGIHPSILRAYAPHAVAWRTLESYTHGVASWSPDPLDLAHLNPPTVTLPGLVGRILAAWDLGRQCQIIAYRGGLFAILRAIEAAYIVRALESGPLGPDHPAHGIRDLAGLPDSVAPSFRAPHHTASREALLGTLNTPGELDLALGGVLVLDDVEGFGRTVIGDLAEHLPTVADRHADTRIVTITYADGSPIHGVADPLHRDAGMQFEQIRAHDP